MADPVIESAPRPEPDRLEAVSPTRAERLRRCGYRVAFDLDDTYDDLRRRHPIPLLGTAAHKMMERSYRGEFDGVPDADLRGTLETAWSDEIERAWTELDEEWPMGPVPEPPETPGYELTRVRLMRRLQRIVRDRDHKREERDRAAETTPGRDRVEGWLEDPSIGLRGRPDRIDRDPDGDVIVDLKTGWTQDEIRDHQRRQLLLYAHLWNAETGALPVRAAVETVSGKRHTFEVDADEVAELVEQVRHALERFNGGVADVEQLARPSPEACEHCPYQSVCGPFFRSYEPEWFFERAVVGTVGGRSEQGWIDLEASYPIEQSGSTVRVLDVPVEEIPSPGTIVAVTNALPTEIPDQIRARWSTRMLIWDTEGP